MTIRTQLMLLMVPLFAGAAIVISALNYAVQMRELRWALTEEVSSVAVAAAEFVRADVLTGAQLASPASIEQRFRTILDRGAAQRLCLVMRDNRVRCEVASPASALTTMPPVAEETWSSVEESYLVGVPATADNGRLYLLSWAPVMGSQSVAAVVIAEISAEPVRVKRREILRIGGILTGAAALLGVLAALAIGEYLARRIRMLSRMAASLESRQLSTTVDDGIIREMNELAGTFSTVNSVFRDIISKTTRTRLDGGQFRGETEAARTFAARFFPPTSTRIARTVLSATPTGSTSDGRFATAWNSGGMAWGLVLSLKTGESLETVTRASACATYLRQTVETATPEHALADAAELFDVGGVDLLRVGGDGRTGEHWSRGTDGLHHREMKCGRGGLFAGHASGATDTRLQALAKLYDAQPPEVRLAQIRASLGDEAAGALLYVAMDES